MVESGGEQFDQALIDEKAWQALLNRPEVPRDPVALLQRAKKGVEEFRKLYKAGNQEWRHILTQTEIGENIQAMYLGIKPAFNIIEAGLRGIVFRHLPRHYGVVKTKFVYDPKLVSEVMARHDDIFTDYTPEEQRVDTYIQSLVTSPTDYRDSFKLLKAGLVYGYPRTSVIQYAKNITTLHTFSSTTQTYGYQQLTPHEQEMRFLYRKGHKDIPGATWQQFQASEGVS